MCTTPSAKCVDSNLRAQPTERTNVHFGVVGGAGLAVRDASCQPPCHGRAAALLHTVTCYLLSYPHGKVGCSKFSIHTKLFNTVVWSKVGSRVMSCFEIF